VQYGIRANEQGIRSQIQTLAVFPQLRRLSPAPMGRTITALSERVAKNLSRNRDSNHPGDSDGFGNRAVEFKDAGARQEQSKALLQDIVDQARAFLRIRWRARFWRFRQPAGSFQTTRSSRS